MAAAGIVQTARELMDERDTPSLMRDSAELTPRLIAGYCEQGDRLAIEVYQRTGYWLGLGLATYASIVNPGGHHPYRWHLPCRSVALRINSRVLRKSYIH